MLPSYKHLSHFVWALEIWAIGDDSCEQYDDVSDCQLRPPVTKADPICCDHVSLEGGPGCGQGLSGWPGPHQKPPLSLFLSTSAQYLDFINWGTVCCPFNPRKRLANDRISKDNRLATTFWARWQVAESKSYCNGDQCFAHTVTRLSSVMNFNMMRIYKRLETFDMCKLYQKIAMTNNLRSNQAWQTHTSPT